MSEQSEIVPGVFGSLFGCTLHRYGTIRIVWTVVMLIQDIKGDIYSHSPPAQ